MKMLRKIIFPLLFLLVCDSTYGFKYSEAQKTLKAFREKESLFGDGGNGSMALSPCPYNKGDMKRIVVSATRAMEFFEKNLNNMVMDAAVGTRIMESQLMLLQAGHPKLPQSLQMYLMTLQFKSELLSEEIIDKFTDQMLENKMSEQERQRLFLQFNWINNASLWESPSLGTWKTPQNVLGPAFNSLNESSFEDTQETMNEQVSDRCISDIFQTCDVIPPCAKIFMEKAHSKYSLTHQILFFLIAKKQNCFNDERFKLKTANSTKGPTEFVKELCERVWDEANAIEISGFPASYRDLFAEQITVCSLAGYNHFLKHSWLENILSWQNQEESTGCFLKMDEISGNDSSESGVGDYIETMLKMKEPAAGIKSRVKRAEQVLRIGDDNCSVHFTSVCLGSLAMHLRYFADTCLKNY